MGNPVMTAAVGKLAEALGLTGKKVAAVSLHFKADELVRAEVTMYLDKEQADGVVEIVKRYWLVESGS